MTPRVRFDPTKDRTNTRYNLSGPTTGTDRHQGAACDYGGNVLAYAQRLTSTVMANADVTQFVGMVDPLLDHPARDPDP